MSAKISALSQKLEIIANDIFTLLDSEDSNTNKKATMDTVVKLTNVSNAAATAKATPVDDDTANIFDSADSSKIKKVKLIDVATYIKDKVKQSVITDSTSTTPSLNVASNTRYVFTSPLTSLTISAIIDSVLESEIQFQTSGTFAFTATPLSNKWLNEAPTFEANKKYIISIKSGLAVFGEIL